MRPDLDPRHQERSLGELFGDLTHETGELIRKEVELAKVGLAETIADIKAGFTGMIAGAVLSLAGAMLLLLAVVRALDPLMPVPWLAPLIVGGVIVVIGIVALMIGRKRVRKADLVPDESVESLRATKEMVRHHVVSDPH